MRGKRSHAREHSLRRNQTEAERALWTLLRDRRLLGVKFRRQHRLGPYIVDFAAVEQRLVVEVDGSQHLDSTSDETRTRYLEALGFSVLRFWNDDVLARRDLVLHSIALALDPPHPP